MRTLSEGASLFVMVTIVLPAVPFGTEPQRMSSAPYTVRAMHASARINNFILPDRSDPASDNFQNVGSPRKVAKSMRVMGFCPPVSFPSIFCCFVALACASDPLPYPHGSHGSRISNNEALRIIRSYEQTTNATYTAHPANNARSGDDKPVVSHYRIERSISSGFITATLFTLQNPVNHFSFKQPEGGCGANRVRASLTAARADCEVATNGGFFDTHNGDCLGTLVSDGKVHRGLGRDRML